MHERRTRTTRHWKRRGRCFQAPAPTRRRKGHWGKAVCDLGTEHSQQGKFGLRDRFPGRSVKNDTKIFTAEVPLLLNSFMCDVLEKWRQGAITVLNRNPFQFTISVKAYPYCFACNLNTTCTEVPRHGHDKVPQHLFRG